MTRHAAVAILPSRNEATTIGAVVKAIDRALGDPAALIVNADSSDDAHTVESFVATATVARRLSLRDLPRGKGAQILAGIHRAEPDGKVLVADTDTRHPDPEVYRRLLDGASGDHLMAIADYPRYWDEANLTSHLARPLIAATTGVDVPQPLAGDLALAPAAIDTVLQRYTELPRALVPCVNGYGIDAFLLLSTLPSAPPRSISIERVKHHGSSFPHLPQIYREAVPVLLHATAHMASSRNIHHAEPVSRPHYRVAQRVVSPERRTAMMSALNTDAAAGNDADTSWAAALVLAWGRVAQGSSSLVESDGLWPLYLRQVRSWLDTGQCSSSSALAARLARAHEQLQALMELTYIEETC